MALTRTAIQELHEQNRLAAYFLEDIPCTIYEHSPIYDDFIKLFKGLNNEMKWFDTLPDGSLKVHVQMLDSQTPKTLRTPFQNIGFLFDAAECPQVEDAFFKSSLHLAVTARKIKAIIVSEEDLEGWDICDRLSQAMTIRHWLTKEHPELFPEPLPILGYDSHRGKDALAYDTHRKVFQKKMDDELREVYSEVLNNFLLDVTKKFITNARETVDIEPLQLGIKLGARVSHKKDLALRCLAAREDSLTDRLEMMRLLLEHGADSRVFGQYPALLGTEDIYGATDSPEIAGHLVAYAMKSPEPLKGALAKHYERMQTELQDILSVAPAERLEKCIDSEGNILESLCGLIAAGFLPELFHYTQWREALPEARELYGALRRSAPPIYRSSLDNVDISFFGRELARATLPMQKAEVKLGGKAR